MNPNARPDGCAPDRRPMIRRLGGFVWENKVWWITPTVLILLFLAVIVYYTNGASIVPFFYSLF